jgi:phosphate acetyltransferase
MKLNYSVGAMQLRTTYYTLKALVITPGDRADIIWVHCKLMNANYPAISGIVLTGNIVPDDSIYY